MNERNALRETGWNPAEYRKDNILFFLKMGEKRWHLEECWHLC